MGGAELAGLIWRVAVITAALFAPACERDRSRPAAEAAEAGTVRMQIGSQPFTLEVAATPKAQQLGLMHRESMPADHGMIFVFPDERPLSFWMKNTLIPLDMIFIGADWRIAGIVENAEPKTLTSREVPAPSQYVLEIGGGLSALYGIHAGQVVDFQAGSGSK